MGRVVLGTGTPEGRAGRGESIDAEREVLVVDLLVGAVGDDFFQCGIELVAQLVVTFAHGNADLVVFVDRVALELVVLAGFGLQPFIVGIFVGEDGVEAAGGQVQVGVFLAVIEVDLEVAVQAPLSSSQVAAWVERWVPMVLPLSEARSVLKSTFFGAMNCCLFE